MAGDHYMPWFIGDFSAATAAWPGEQQGLYAMALALSWSAGFLPESSEICCRLLKWDVALFSRDWPAVRAKFFLRDGKLYNR